jgi:hypothetical protein
MTTDLRTCVTLFVRWAYRFASQLRGLLKITRKQSRARQRNRRTTAWTPGSSAKTGRSRSRRT